MRNTLEEARSDPGYAVVGKRIPKLDAPDKVVGRTVYADDLRMSGLLIGAIKRSPHPHARIVTIDASGAEALPGVHAVIHAGNVQQRPFGYGGDNIPLKAHVVRCVGDEVAAVAAVDAATAQRAVQLIDIEYDLLPSVDDPFEALAPDAPRIHDELDIDGNVSMEWNFQTGDLAEAERRSAVIVRGSYSSPQAAPAPIETHVVIAGFDAEGDLEVISPVHMVFMYRKELADCLGLDWRRINVRQPPVGGSFGGKIDIDTHDFITVMLARAAEVLGRPADSLTIRGGVISPLDEPQLELRYDKAVRRRLLREGRFPAPNLHDYGMPTAVDVPPIDVTLVETDDELGPFGAKGIGEGGIILPPAAIANAVADAVGVRPRCYPMRPWKLRKWIETGERSNIEKLDLGTRLGVPARSGSCYVRQTVRWAMDLAGVGAAAWVLASGAGSDASTVWVCVSCRSTEPPRRVPQPSCSTTRTPTGSGRAANRHGTASCGSSTPTARMSPQGRRESCGFAARTCSPVTGTVRRGPGKPSPTVGT